MGDVIGSIFGTSSTTTQQNVPDPVSQALNFQRLREIINLFSTGSVNQFAGAEPGIYTPTDQNQRLIDRATELNGPLDYSNLMSLDDYRGSFNPITQSYESAATGLNNTTGNSLNALQGDYVGMRDALGRNLDEGRGRAYGDYNTGVGVAQGAYGQGGADVTAAYNAAIARGDYDLARSIASTETNAGRALQGNAANFEGILNLNRGNADNALSLVGDSTNRNLGENRGNYLNSLGVNEGVAQRGINRNDQNLLRSLAISGADANRSLGTQNANRARALDLGIGATGNYIDQIARPRLEQALALQGLESGGAVPAAIARATAEAAMPYLQGVENTYGTNQANTLNSLMALRGQLTGSTSAQDAAIMQELLGLQSGLGGDYTKLNSGVLSQLTGLQSDIGSKILALQSGVGQQYAGTQADVYGRLSGEQAAAQGASQAQNAALGGQRVGAQADLASGYQSNIAQLAQALMANGITLEQAGIAANSALGQQLMQAQTTLRSNQQQGLVSAANTYGSNAANFASTLPGASTALTMAPVQARAGQAATLSALQPLTDYPRQLREADFLRRQGLFTTSMTGIPYTPGGTTMGGSATGNIFDQLGGTISSGVTGGSGGFSSLGTKT